MKRQEILTVLLVAWAFFSAALFTVSAIDSVIRDGNDVVLNEDKLLALAGLSDTMSMPYGRIAFHSNRNGNNEVYVMNADGSKQRNLTNLGSEDWRPSWSPDGQRIAFMSNRSGDFEIWIMNADGSGLVNMTQYPSNDRYPSWSPDGQFIAFHSDRSGRNQIWIMDLADPSDPFMLTDDPGVAWGASWSPDSRMIAFTSKRDGNDNIYRINIDGTDEVRLTDDPAYDGIPVWSPDGSAIVFETGRDGPFEIYIMDAMTGENPKNLTNHASNDKSPAWSYPAGDRIVFTSDRNGNEEIYVMDSDGGNQVRLTDSPGADWGPAFWCSVDPAPHLEVGILLDMPVFVRPGDDFWITGTLVNHHAPLENCLVFFVLQINDEYWFWPTWSYSNSAGYGQIDFRIFDIPTGSIFIDVLPVFEWIDTGDALVTDLWFWGMILDSDSRSLLGDYAVMKWGFGPE